MDRVAVVGNSGTGKTSLARLLARRLQLPHTELDAIFHQPGWGELDEVDFRGRVGALAAEGRWVIDGNYRPVRELIWKRADTVVWLDLPRALVLRRVVWRTARRVLTRQVLWNGNRESLRNALSWNPQRSIIRWAWTQHASYGDRFQQAMEDAAFGHLTFIRLRSPAEVNAFISELSAVETPDLRP
jgi:adenylate kinase family enzyme